MKMDPMSHIFSYHLNVLLISVPNVEMSRHGSPKEKVTRIKRQPSVPNNEHLVSTHTQST